MNNEPEILDLDKLMPEARKVKIQGRVVEILPGKFKTILKLQKAFKNFKEATTDEQEAAMQSLLDILIKMIPALKDDDMDIGFDQIGPVVEIAFQSVSPEKPKELEANGMLPTVDEKKMVVPSPEQ